MMSIWTRMRVCGCTHALRAGKTSSRTSGRRARTRVCGCTHALAETCLRLCAYVHRRQRNHSLVCVLQQAHTVIRASDLELLTHGLIEDQHMRLCEHFGQALLPSYANPLSLCSIGTWLLIERTAVPRRGLGILAYCVVADVVGRSGLFT